MLRVGLTGGYATGKSFVASLLERLGAKVIYADRLGHEVLLSSGEAFRPVVDLFGAGILDNNGEIDRKLLGRQVFSDPEQLARLTAIIHPCVFRREEALMQAYERENPAAIVVLEAAILIEAGRQDIFDRLIVTTCPLETQIERGMNRDGVSREQVIERISRQMPLNEKIAYADYVIDTSGSKIDTERRVSIVFDELRKLAEKS